jgi:hypothetical protein
MTSEEIYSNYFNQYGVINKKCGKCKIEKPPNQFPLSRTMESGLHNQCRECVELYTESLGERWIKFNPDGHTIHRKKKSDKCTWCESKNKLHYDHKWPISKGGTDYLENFQLLCEKHNFEKKSSVSEFATIQEINSRMICSRYHTTLEKARYDGLSIREFEINISSEVRKFIKMKCKMTDKQLREFYLYEKQKNNRKFNIDRAIDKFRAYCETQDLNND